MDSPENKEALNKKWKRYKPMLLDNSEICSKAKSASLKIIHHKTVTADAMTAVVEQYEALKESDYIKSGKKRRVAQVPYQDTKYLIKEFRNPGPWGPFASDYRSWIYANRLKFYGINVPESLAWVHKDSKAFIISEFIEGKNPGKVLQNSSEQEQITIANKFNSLLRQMYRLGIVHEDMKIGNFIMDPAGTLYIVDNDAVLFDRTVNKKDWQRNRKHILDLPDEKIKHFLSDYFDKQIPPYRDE